MLILADLILTYDVAPVDVDEAHEALVEHLETDFLCVGHSRVRDFTRDGVPHVRAALLFVAPDDDLDMHLEDAFSDRAELSYFEQIGGYITVKDHAEFHHYVAETSDADLDVELQAELAEAASEENE